LFYTALNRFRQQEGLGARKGKFRFKNKLLSLDSTTISLCLELFPWAKFRRAKGGVKAHVLLDHDDYQPSFVLVTEAQTSDVRVAQNLDLNPDSIVAFDRGYNDYALFGDWTQRDAFFVTRLKDNAAYEVVESAMGPLPRRAWAPARNILADELIRFTSVFARIERRRWMCPANMLSLGTSRPGRSMLSAPLPSCNPNSRIAGLPHQRRARSYPVPRDACKKRVRRR
jgi:hypothetical protein